MLLALRLSMPDRPGMLAQVTAGLAAVDADIACIEVIERAAGLVVDELVLSVSGIDPISLSRRLEGVAGVVVESVRVVEELPSVTTLLELTEQLVSDPGMRERLPILVAGVPKAMRAGWCLAVSDLEGRTRVLHASSAAPRLTPERLPWMPLDGPRRLAPAGWMPTSWRMRAALGGLELAAWPLAGPHQALLVGRYSGLRFRTSELRQLELLISIADADGSLRRELIPPLLSQHA